MHSSTFVLPRFVAASIFWVSTASSGWAADSVDPLAVRCQQTITAAGHAFVVGELSDLGRCAGASLACAETAPDDAECVPAARKRCERTLARVLRRQRKLARTVVARCGALAGGALLGESGLGFARLAPLCPALATERGDAEVLGACLAGLDRCRAERLFAAAFPRAAELLRTVGVAASARAALMCLPDRGGGGRGVRDPELGAAITRCVRATARATARLASRTLVNASRCTRAVRACLGAASDAAAVDGTDCRAGAAATCGAAFARVADGRRAFGRTLAGACGADDVGFAALAAPIGADLGALADECGAVGVEEVDGMSAFAECVARRHECELADLLRATDPRIDELVALGGASLAYPHCAAPTPTESATPAATAPPPPEPTPTPTATGPTRTPHPGETATPTPRATRTPSPVPTATPFCGNGVIDDGEECDGDSLDDNRCDDLCFEVGPNPTLSCAADCTFDFSGCQGVDCEPP